MLLSDALIIDATERLGWLAGRLLADLGADVIKIAQPGTDRSRPEWRACNVNKRILELDPQIPGDRMRIEELLRTADICLLTPAPCSTGSFLDPHALRRDYPRLVVVAIRPFGGVGPRRTWKASDIELMAAGGAMALAGEPDGMPVRISEPQSYGWAGAYAAAGALVALFRRDTTGRGDLVDVSAQASVIAALSHAPAFVDLLGIEPTRAGAFMTGRSITGARYRVFWPCRDGYINFIFYGGAAGRRTNEQLVVWMRECGAELGALAAIDWKSWDPTKADQAEVDAIEAPVATFFARLTKREFLIEGHRRGMLGYPVATVADIASDPQLEARGFFQTVADSAERFCGSFAVIDGKRPPLRHHPDAPILAAHALCSAPHRTGAPSAFEIGRNRVNPISAGEALGAIRVNLTSVSQAQRSTSHKRVHARLRRAMAKWCAADPGSLRSVAVSDQRRTASLRFALHRIRDTWLKLMPKGLAAGVDISARSRGHNHDPLPQTSPPREDGADRVRCSSVTAVAHALCGLKVLEFGGYAAGPHIGKLLANFGASTIHMESRERPDGFRIQYPPFKDNRPGYNRSGCFAFFNDSKYSVTVDLKKPAGIALARRMAQWCDLIIENMRPGVMERLGLGFAVLSQLNPRLVMLSSCNMGQTGPRADQPGFGSQLSALAGMCEVTGVPEGPPMLLYGPYIDYIASLLGTSAALAAVIRGRRTGKGALIDLSQYECGLTFMGAALWDFFANGRVASRRGNDDPVAMPHGAFPCCEREWVAISCWSDADFASLAQAIGDVKLATDARFATAPARRANRKALDAMISAWTAQRKAEAAATALQAAGVAAYPVVTMAGLFSDPQLRARRQFRVRRHPEMGDHAYCFPGFDLEDAPGDIVGPAPCVGADNDFVFRDLIGLSEAEYETYRRQGVFD